MRGESRKRITVEWQEEAALEAGWMKVNHNSRGGQAMVELVISLVVFMVLVAGIIQIGTLGKRQTEMMNEARQEAAVEAMKDVSPFSSPEYMADRLEGDDAVRYSRDDGYKAGFVDDFQNGIVDYAKPVALDQRLRGNIVSEMAGTPFPHLLFGLVEGRADDTVELMPVVRHLLYQADSIEVEGRAWLVWTKGIY